MQFDPWFFDAVSGPSAIIDSEGTILSVNEDWQRFATENGAATDAGKDRFALGANYLEVCSKASGQQSKGAISVADGIRSVMKGETPQFVHEYPCHAPQQQRWFKCLVRALPDTVDKGKTFLIQHGFRNRTGNRRRRPRFHAGAGRFRVLRARYLAGRHGTRRR